MMIMIKIMIKIKIKILMMMIDDGSSDDLDVPIKVVDCPRLNLSVLGFSFIDLMCSMTRLKYREI